MKVEHSEFNNYDAFPTDSIVNAVLVHRNILVDQERKYSPNIVIPYQTKYDVIGINFDHYFWVAMVDNNVIGSVGLVSNENNACMHCLWVDADFRGYGIGKFLFELANKKSMILGKEMQFYVSSKNPEAIKFYDAIGCINSYTIMIAPVV